MRKINHCSSIIRKFTRKLLPCLLISLFLLFNFLFLPLAPAAANQDVVFKDANFKAAVLQMLRNQDILTELDTEISRERADKLTKLTLENAEISSLEDIVNFPSLRILQIKESRISDLSPLQKLNFLRSLNIQKSRISNLQPLKTVDSLTYLNLSYNQISDLTPLAQLTSLTELYLADNKITDIAALANLEELTELNLAGNNLSDLTPLAAITANLGSLILNNNNWTYKAEKREIDLPFKVKNSDQIKLSIAAADKDKVEITGTKIKLLNLQGKTSLELQYTSTIGGRENYRKKQEFTYQGTITLDVTAIKTARKYAADPQMPFGQTRSEFDEYGNEIVYKGTASVSSEITVPHVTLPDKENFIVKKGRDGKKQRVKTYTVNPLNGDITETVSEKEIVSAVDDTYEKKEMTTPDKQVKPQPNNPQPGVPQPNNPPAAAPKQDQSDSPATQPNNPPAAPDTQANPQPNRQPNPQPNQQPNPQSNPQPNKQQAGTQKTNQSTSPAVADQANLDVPKKSEQQISSPAAASWQPKAELPTNPVGKSGEKRQTRTAGLTILISVLGILIAAGKLPIVRRKC
ncbi:leucine-rich repeat domain-containing protein [Amygdalobacter indicium]|uniref:Leucine-rich repeat domain-containing protein n=1 Tax=Amygdalobacter indicium TaxID=3029272 RepID=A0ABY8C3G5_9FIRM|nr:leucine-rich repeat domain-containing protein [Amygdalobacter indicium]WEG35218.1 leucine-rich repeat domain-containing protein [Amygdalobacter indicium]